jgi:hypothetical protein
MKNHNVLVAIIISAALLASAIIISSALNTFGKSMERAALAVSNGMAASRPATMPSSIRLDLGEIKIGNGGGAGESFRIQTVAK